MGRNCTLPELPEVETTLRGIQPHLLNQQIVEVTVRQPQLRWPVPADLATQLQGQTIKQIYRRGKYLIFSTDRGHQLLHLGMSGSVRVLPENTAANKHDHVDWRCGNGLILRLNDPRRFGSVLWTQDDPSQHKLIASLGPEPLSDEFSEDYLLQKSRGRKANVKSFIMDSKTVVGVGNIYASESLYLAGIHPKRAAGNISAARYKALTQAIKTTLAKAIEAGGTTLKDFTSADGKPGYFKQQLHVYGRGGEACNQCAAPIQQAVLNQRMTYWCKQCQR